MCRFSLKNEVYYNSCYSYSMRCKWLGRVFCNLALLRLNRHTLPQNSAGHTLFLFFTTFMRSKSALYHLLCEATCSLGTDKQLGNVTSVVEYSKLVTAQVIGPCTSYTFFFSGSCIFHVSNIIVELRKLIQVIT